MKTKMTEKTFRAVKLMTAGGANIAEIAECFDMSSSTVTRIRASESYEDYCSLRTAEYGKRKLERVEKARKASEQASSQTVPHTFAASQFQPQLPQAYAAPQVQQPAQPQAFSAQQVQQPDPPALPQVVEHRQTVTIQATHYMMQEMKKTNELLELISRKLAFIVDQLS